MKIFDDFREKSVFARLISGRLRFPRKRFPASGSPALDTLLHDRFDMRWLDNTAAYHMDRRLFTYLKDEYGDRIPHGIFKGMRFDPNDKAFLTAMRFGTYEPQMMHLLRKCLSRPYNNVTNVGCAEGYYAVGCSMLFQKPEILALDYVSSLLDQTMRLAKLNGVENRITTGGKFDFESPASDQVRNSLMIIDIEGGESELLKNPDAYQDTDMIIEIHEGFYPEICSSLEKTFGNSHEVEILNLADINHPGDPLPDMSAFCALETAMLLFCNRGVENKWGLFKSKSLGSKEAQPAGPGY